MTAPRPTLHLRPMSELTSEHGTVIIFHTPEIYGTCTMRTIARCEETLPDFLEGLIGWCELPELVLPCVENSVRLSAYNAAYAAEVMPGGENSGRLSPSRKLNASEETPHE